MPSPIARDEFAADAAQKLGIDSALMRNELKMAASRRRESVSPMRASTCSEAERILLRALSLPSNDPTFAQAVAALEAQPECFASIGVAHLLDPLRLRTTHDALDALEPGSGRAMLAEILMREGGELSPEELEGAVATLRHHHLQQKQRALRAEIAEAERQNDQQRLLTLTAQKLTLDRALREA
jgi:DNA primase